MVFLSNCGLIPPKPDFCVIEDTIANCYPTDPNKSEYELQVEDMVGYICESPKDFGDTKKFLKKVLKALDNVDGQ
jgi:hypothetical protein